MVSRAGRQIARKISVPPKSTKAVSGYTDHQANFMVGKVSTSKNSISGINAPKAINAPPMIYSIPFRTYRSRVTTAVTTRATKPVTGKAKLKNQLPAVAKLIYNK